MTEALIGILVGMAAVIAAFFAGKSNQRNQMEKEKAEENYDAPKLAEAIKIANDSVPDNDLRKWMRDNAKK